MNFIEAEDTLLKCTSLGLLFSAQFEKDLSENQSHRTSLRFLSGSRPPWTHLFDDPDWVA